MNIYQAIEKMTFCLFTGTVVHMLNALFCYFRYSRPSNKSFQGRSAELLHYHQQRHYSEGGCESRRARIQLDGSPGDLFPLRSVRQPWGSHQTAETSRSILKISRQDSTQWTVKAPLFWFQFGFIWLCLLGLRHPKETLGKDVLMNSVLMKIGRYLLRTDK